MPKGSNVRAPWVGLELKLDTLTGVTWKPYYRDILERANLSMPPEYLGRILDSIVRLAWPDVLVIETLKMSSGCVNRYSSASAVTRAAEIILPIIYTAVIQASRSRIESDPFLRPSLIEPVADYATAWIWVGEKGRRLAAPSRAVLCCGRGARRENLRRQAHKQYRPALDLVLCGLAQPRYTMGNEPRRPVPCNTARLKREAAVRVRDDHQVVSYAGPDQIVHSLEVRDYESKENSLGSGGVVPFANLLSF